MKQIRKSNNVKSECLEMCPIDEQRLRIKHNLIHTLEKINIKYEIN
jgi:hypothetical protein